jgi:hypothetical protein
VGDSLCVFGGNDGGTNDSVLRARIDANGNLSTFSTLASETLTSGGSWLGTALVGHSVYVLGGWNGASLDTADRVTFNTSGDLGALSTGATALQVGRGTHGSAVVGDSVYVLGGSDGTDLKSIERAVVGTDGSIGAFATQAVELPAVRRNFATAVAGNFLWVLGGYDLGGPKNTIWQFPINGDGSLGNPALLLATLGTARGYFSAAVLGSNLYAVAGFGGTYRQDVERFTINADGTLTAQAAGPSLNTVRNNYVLAVIRNYLYVVGGQNSGGAVGTVERAPIGATGLLSAFADAGVGLVTPRYQAAGAVIGDYLYVLGGFNGGALGSVERAKINADGTLQAFQTVKSLALTTARSTATPALLGDSLLLMGGSGLASVERAALQ